ncbi:helix-turn-helix domain-containing protein [Pseudobutyrivibrio sp.]
MISTADEKSRVSKNIKYLLEVKKKTRKQVATDLGYKYTTFCDWVNGNTTPSYSSLEKLGQYFNIEPWQFYGDLAEGKVGRAKALVAYANAAADAKLLDISMLDNLGDAQIKSLMESGFRFRHKTLEEYEGVKITISTSDAATELSVSGNQLFISNGDVNTPVPLSKVVQLMDIMQAVLDENS